jgi:hypothetical protein
MAVDYGNTPWTSAAFVGKAGAKNKNDQQIIFGKGHKTSELGPISEKNTASSIRLIILFILKRMLGDDLVVRSSVLNSMKALKIFTTQDNNHVMNKIPVSYFPI